MDSGFIRNDSATTKYLSFKFEPLFGSAVSHFNFGVLEYVYVFKKPLVRDFNSDNRGNNMLLF